MTGSTPPPMQVYRVDIQPGERPRLKTHGARAARIVSCANATGFVRIGDDTETDSTAVPLKAGTLLLLDGNDLVFDFSEVPTGASAYGFVLVEVYATPGIPGVGGSTDDHAIVVPTRDITVNMASASTQVVLAAADNPAVSNYDRPFEERRAVVYPSGVAWSGFSLLAELQVLLGGSWRTIGRAQTNTVTFEPLVLDRWQTARQGVPGDSNSAYVQRIPLPVGVQSRIRLTNTDASTRTVHARFGLVSR